MLKFIQNFEYVQNNQTDPRKFTMPTFKIKKKRNSNYSHSFNIRPSSIDKMDKFRTVLNESINGKDYPNRS